MKSLGDFMNIRSLKNIFKDYFVTWPKHKFSKKEYEYKVLRNYLSVLLILYIINIFILYYWNSPKTCICVIMAYYLIVSPIRPIDEDDSVMLFTNKYFLSTFLIYAVYCYILL